MKIYLQMYGTVHYLNFAVNKLLGTQLLRKLRLFATEFPYLRVANLQDGVQRDNLGLLFT